MLQFGFCRMFFTFCSTQRHSAGVDFWIDTSSENLDNLLLVVNDMGYQLNDFPAE